MNQFNDQIEQRNLPSKEGKFRFLREGSKLDYCAGDKLPSKLRDANPSGISVSNDPEIRKSKQKAFLLEIMPEIFHDVRSPMISWLSLFELMEHNDSVRENLVEFCGEIVSEIKIVLKRVDNVERLFAHLAKPDHLNPARKELAIVLEHVRDILEMKIKRKRLNVVFNIDKAIDTSMINITQNEINFLIFELFYRIVEFSSNRDTIVVKSTGNELKFHLEPQMEWGVDDSEFVPVFLPEKWQFRRMSYKGFSVSF